MISTDPVLCARVLRLANSPFYGGRRTIASIDDGVAAIGTQALSTLLIAAGVTAAFVEVPGVHLRDFWMHSAVAAAAADALAQHAGVDRAEAYLGGLLHESGHLILCQAFPDAARRHFDHHRSRHGMALAAIEQAAFGASHPEISAQWCRSLQLPDSVTEAVAGYLLPAPGEPGRLSTILHLGATLAAAIGDDATADEALGRLDQRLAAQGVLNLDALTTNFAPQYVKLRQSCRSF